MYTKYIDHIHPPSLYHLPFSHWYSTQTGPVLSSYFYF
jgi:hypothetical protein